MGGLVALLLAACGGDPTAPPPVPPLGGGGAGGGANQTMTALVGSWRTVVLFRTPMDLLTTTTTWQFGQSGGCRRTIETFSLLEGFPQTTERNCTFHLDVNDLVITFVGDTATIRFRFDFEGFSPQRLLLDGIVFDRIE